jgi:signal-transduction protein with cAMP-binding, CBS, and nucleotidyltransferase domain
MKLVLKDKQEEPEIIQFLRKVPLFSGLNDEALRTLIKETREISYPEGKMIMREGEPSVVFHLILDGKVEIKKKKGHSQDSGEVNSSARWVY